MRKHKDFTINKNMEKNVENIHGKLKLTDMCVFFRQTGQNSSAETFSQAV